MAFGKAIFAKALDLLEAALGEVPSVSLADHAVDHALAVIADGAGALEGGHGAAQFIGLARLEAAGDNGDLHRLFLKQRHTQRLAENRFQLRLGVFGALLALPAAQIGMHHVALDRAGPHDRHLDDKVVESRVA